MGETLGTLEELPWTLEQAAAICGYAACEELPAFAEAHPSKQPDAEL